MQCYAAPLSAISRRSAPLTLQMTEHPPTFSDKDKVAEGADYLESCFKIQGIGYATHGTIHEQMLVRVEVLESIPNLVAAIIDLIIYIYISNQL